MTKLLPSFLILAWVLASPAGLSAECPRKVIEEVTSRFSSSQPSSAFTKLYSLKKWNDEARRLFELELFALDIPIMNADSPAPALTPAQLKGLGELALASFLRDPTNSFLHLLYLKIHPHYRIKLPRLTPAQLKAAADETGRSLKSLSLHSDTAIDFRDWSRMLQLMNPLVIQASKVQRSQIANIVANTLVRRASRFTVLSGVKNEKFFYAIKQNIKELLGLESKALVDFTITQDEASLNVILIKTHAPLLAKDAPDSKGPFSEEILSDIFKSLGVHIEFLGRLSKTTIKSKLDKKSTGTLRETYLWKLGKQQITSTISFVSTPHRLLNRATFKGDSPDYPSMLKDRHLKGAIFIDRNLAELHSELVVSYVDYFKAKGFVFSAKPKIISESMAFFKQAIREGEWDYCVREGHGFSSDLSVALSSKELRVYEGVRKSKTGPTETIQIIEPKTESPEREIPLADFRDWIRAREPHNGQLLYFDSACFSLNPSCSLMNKVGSDRLHVLGTSGIMATFTGEKGSPIYAFLEGVRNQLPYAKIRKNMAPATAEFDGEVYFPDQEAYWNGIKSEQDQSLLAGVDITLDSRDAAGNFVDLGI